MDSLTADFFTNNRNRLVDSIAKPGVIVVPGNGQMQRSADTAYGFRQDSNFYYLTGINEPCATLVIDMVRRTSWIMLPMRSGLHAVFDGEIDLQQIRDISGVQEIISESEGWRRLRTMANEQIYMPHQPAVKLQNMYTNPHRRSVHTKLRRIVKSITDIRQQLNALRVIKQPSELILISAAATATYKTLKIVNDTLRNYATEKQLETEISRQFILNDADGHAYSPIIASGINSCTLHYGANNKPLKKGDVVLFDVGAEVSNYASDISRTIVYDSPPTSRQQEVLQAVSEVQYQLINHLKPGVTFKNLSQTADQLVAEKLIALGLISKQYSSSDIRRYFPHSVSHFMGLDVHDVGDYTKSLQENMVITVEPGIYINDESLGVRIEDDVVITHNGAVIIGKALPALI